MPLLAKFKLMLTLFVTCALLTGCFGASTKLMRTESSGAWETSERESGLRGKPGKMVQSMVYGRGNGDSRYSAHAQPYLNVRESPDGKVDIIYFPGLQSPSQPSFSPNQHVNVLAQYSRDRGLYQYRFTADSVDGAVLFFTDLDRHAFIRKMETEQFVTLSVWDRARGQQWINQFVIEGRPHLVVRQAK